LHDLFATAKRRTLVSECLTPLSLTVFTQSEVRFYTENGRFAVSASFEGA